MVREQVAAGVTVVLTTQYLEEADQLADEIVVIDFSEDLKNGLVDRFRSLPMSRRSP